MVCSCCQSNGAGTSGIQLNLSNGFLFGEVMENEETCKVLVEIIFGRKVRRIRKAAKERHLDVDGFHNSISKGAKRVVMRARKSN